MRSLLRIPAILACFSLLYAQTPKPISGFSSEAARKQLELETQFEQSLRAQNLQQWMKRMASKPHHVGSPGSREVAEFMADLFKSWGYETQIETYYPLFATPKTRVLELLGPEKFTAKLDEPAVEGDATSGIRGDNLPPYNAYSTDGDVTADLVYVNYGLPADYERLKMMGIDVKGKIVIARYGASWRGIKPKVAAENGAVGCLIYSDPRDDGYGAGDVYPKGAYRSKDSVQRGSVMDMPTYPGDPLTPNVGATDNKRSADPKQASTVTKIPVLPISYGDAEPLLRALAGPVAPGEWRGGLPLTYHIGPGPAKVHLKLEFDWKLAPTHNVVAKMRGSEKPDEWIIRGNHHDGWNFGANDPLSGMVAVMEEARGIGELAKTGWKPKRTIVYTGWDGEEPALLGSTEWVEHHAAELQQKAVAYINSDGTSRGFVSMAGSAMLDNFAIETARDVIDPQTQVSVLDRRKAANEVAGRPADVRLEALGSGSDYTAFLHHLGIASLNIGFGGEGEYGVYHSNYDSYDHFIRFVDPDFTYVLATAKLGGRMTLRLANAETLPFRTDPLSKSIRRWTNEVVKLADDMRAETKRQNDLVREGKWKLAQDPKKRLVAPELKEDVPFLNFAPLLNAVARFEAATAKNPTVSYLAERKLLNSAGLPKRPWFQHMLHAPGYYTGYGVKTLPGVREAIEQREWKEAEKQIEQLAATLNAYVDALPNK